MPATEHKNTPQMTSLLNGPRIARSKMRSSPRDPYQQENEEDEECIDEHDIILDPYWTDILAHPFYSHSYSILGILNIQRGLNFAIHRGYTSIVTLC